ncbi:MAG: hypothetical protein KatS3mg113_0670 [Planctomycetaceae bacterium]|nr:MAG: hypothetical protein KatS3mg113_0670 [Planctomycetaceae bacterium]
MTHLREKDRLRAIASGLVMGGVVLLSLWGMDALSPIGLPVLPRFWQQHRWCWWLLGGVLIAVGGWLLSPWFRYGRGSTWHPTSPGQRFHTLIVYTKSDCPLCDEALEVLHHYRPWLPIPHVVEITGDELLEQIYATTVPVVVCDGKIRFRGKIQPVLLQRLIEGSPPISRASAGDPT